MGRNAPSVGPFQSSALRSLDPLEVATDRVSGDGFPSVIGLFCGEGKGITGVAINPTPKTLVRL